jgi:hypothetical protein
MNLPHAKLSPIAPLSYEMDIDVTVAGKHHSKLTLREPTIEDVLVQSKHFDGTAHGSIQASITLVARCSNTAEIVIKALPHRKFKEAAEYVSGFLEDSPETGSLSAST